MPVHRDPVETAYHRAAVWLLILTVGLGVCLSVWFLWWLRHAVPLA